MGASCSCLEKKLSFVSISIQEALAWERLAAVTRGQKVEIGRVETRSQADAEAILMDAIAFVAFSQPEFNRLGSICSARNGSRSHRRS